MNLRRLTTTTLTLLTLLLTFNSLALAQEPARPEPRPSPAQARQAEPTPAAQTARVRLLAFDSKGRAAPLKKEDVHVYLDGAEQPVTSFEALNVPASYGLVVDNSGSLRSQMNAVIAAAEALALSNGPEDESFVVRFVASDNIKILQELTADKAALSRALYGMFVEGGQTALLDALYLSAEHLAKKARPDAGAGRRLALVLISDGEDRASYYNAEQVLKLLRESDVQVFAIGLPAALDGTGYLLGKSKREKSKDLLDKLTSATGGRVYYVEKVGQLREAVEEIGKSLHAHYVVGYAAPAPDGKRHKLEVKASGPGGKDALKLVLRPDREEKEEKKEKRKG